MQIDYEGFLRKKIKFRSKGSQRSRDLTTTTDSRFRDKLLLTLFVTNR